MPYVFECKACHFKMSISDEMFTRRFEGKQVTVKCKSCKGDIRIDGATLAAKPRASIPRPDPGPVPRPTPSAPAAERASGGARPPPPRSELRKTLLGVSPEELVPRRPAPPRRTRASIATVDPLGVTALDAGPAQVQSANTGPAQTPNAPEARASVPRPDAALKEASLAATAREGTLESAPRGERDGARALDASPAQPRPAPPRRTPSASKLNALRSTVLGVGPTQVQVASEASARVSGADVAASAVSPASAAPEGSLESAPRGEPDEKREPETNSTQALETGAAETPQDVDPRPPRADDGIAPEPEPAAQADAGAPDVETEASFFDREQITPPISWAPGPAIAERKRPRLRHAWAAVLFSVVGIGGGVLAAVRWIPAHGPGRASAVARANAAAVHEPMVAPPRREKKPSPTKAQPAPSPPPEAAPSREQPAPAAPAEQVASASPAGEPSAIPDGVHPNVLQYRVYLAMKKAEDCHRGGRARGKAQVFMTFAPDGHVTSARLEGEPIASAPVGKCVLQQARAVRVPPYQGEPFTYRSKVTLR
jgi:hypothetical protein